MRAFGLSLVLVLAAALVGSGASFAQGKPKCADECTIVRIAERYIAIHFPEFDSLKNPPIVKDEGSKWHVEYELPEGTIGGTPVLVIDKGTLKVERAYRTQ